jgi:hypothetical protein
VPTLRFVTGRGEPKRFGLKNAAIGGLLPGRVGLLGGMVGSKSGNYLPKVRRAIRAGSLAGNSSNSHDADSATADRSGVTTSTPTPAVMSAVEHIGSVAMWTMLVPVGV